MIQKEGGVTAPKGYKAAGIACGMKKDGKPDLALVVSDTTAAAAGVFTRNVVKGHSLQLTMNNIKGRRAKAVLVNSGSANACLGKKGYDDAVEVTRDLARILNSDPGEILMGSTGVIGQALEKDKIITKLNKLTESLSYSGGRQAEEAMMTTDTVAKECSAQIELGGKTVTIGGMAKGSGMIHPNMGTMISIITTDADIETGLLQEALNNVIPETFNRVSVDGDTSVCDMVILLANGFAENRQINKKDKDYELFTGTLMELCTELSKMLAKDGEGATKLLEVRVQNCASKEQAALITNSIIRSPLFKTAMFGEDANWGRIMTAAGYSGAEFDPNTVDINMGPVMVCKNGAALPFNEEEVLKILKSNEILITLDFHSGTWNDRAWTCDFSYDYVKINGSYRS
jgi:glutamate N-acetyltransferase/amino-acid N-acetyltransferase